MAYVEKLKEIDHHHLEISTETWPHLKTMYKFLKMKKQMIQH